MNPREKGMQVQLMGKIYEGSCATLVWLGIDQDGIAVESTDFIRHISGNARTLIDKYGGGDKIPNLSPEENPVSQDKDKWAMYQKFLDHSWFSRTWVMQEVGIAPKVSIHWVC